MRIMSDPLTKVMFQSRAFNTTVRKPYFINSGCFGDDVARWLISKLRANGIRTDDEPTQEDFGWVLGYEVEDVRYELVVGFRPGSEGSEGEWIGSVERPKGILRFFSRRPLVPDCAVEPIHALLSKSPEIGSLSWHPANDLDPRHSTGAPSPFIS